MRKYRVAIESSAAVGFELEIEADNRDDAQEKAQAMLDMKKFDPVAATYELIKPIDHAYTAYGEKIGVKLTYATVELDEAGFEVVDAFDPNSIVE